MYTQTNDPLISTQFPDNISIPPVVAERSRDIPVVPEPHDNDIIYGNGRSDDNYYNNNNLMMPMPPREQNVSYPCLDKVNSSGNCKNKFFNFYAPIQNVMGAVFTDDMKKGNWVRGNQFSPSYDYDKIHKKSVNIEIGKILKKKPKITIKNPFYPEPGYNHKYDEKYKTYQYFDNRNINGFPTMYYPYSILPMNVKNSSVILENYENKGTRRCTLVQKLLIILLILGFLKIKK